ncbi:MAG: bifunctional 4-hydroxy-2-oxoglutarate aldolase/2-dehydro-3-deoxy-phosphogluconate aldolase [Oscillospiraceae bacterium]|nr:bifunctional 4-hydroxy-2-oxoglutarate aldolase/2-dehydro-3-deoxy-phosphogluconate aldolase [Oscillospiraceae bacterium]
MGLFAEKYSSRLTEVGFVPVVCFKNQKELDTFLEAILPTPVRSIEITMRHAFTPEAIAYIKKNHPDFTVGAGTLNSFALMDTALDCGADFFVAPGYEESFIDYAAEKGIPYLPGCSTPSEILHAYAKGFNVLKFFPAEAMGGTKVFKLYEGAFADIKFLPTGGITLNNFGDYSACKNVLACGGSFMVPKDMLASGDSEGINRTMQQCISVYKENRK